VIRRSQVNSYDPSYVLDIAKYDENSTASVQYVLGVHIGLHVIEFNKKYKKVKVKF